MITVTGYRFVLSCVAFVISTPGLAVAQSPAVRIPDGVSCASCRINVTSVATLGDTDGPGALGNIPYGMRVDGRGRIWLWGGDNAGGPSIYDANGRFLRVSGRRGQGPGEFEMVTDVVTLPGDSVLVMDYYRRATLYSGDLSVVRHIPLTATLSSSVVVNWPRSVVGFNHYGAGGRGGAVLHSMAFDSAPPRIVKSFGPEWQITDWSSMAAASRFLAPSATGFWTVNYDPYRIEHWTSDGRRDASFERVPAWPPRTSEGLGKPDEPPPNSVQAIAEDADGRLWVFISVAAPTWREGWPKSAGEMRLSAFAREKMHRTVVEVIDPRAGRVLARHELDEWIIAALPGSRAAIYIVDANDIPRLRIVQLRLEGLR